MSDRGFDKIRMIAWREFRHTVLTKSFLLGAIGVPILMSIGLLAMPALMVSQFTQLKGELAVVDPTGTIGIMVPTEKTRSIKSGSQRVTETKLYPGYVFVEMSLEDDGRIPQDVFFLIKETTGVGDFVGTAGRPTPMSANEVEKMLFDSRKPDETPTVKMEFEKGDPVSIKEGPFENYEGTVDEVMPEKGLVRVLVTIFGRQAPVELEYWQIMKAE